MAIMMGTKRAWNLDTEYIRTEIRVHVCVCLVHAATVVIADKCAAFVRPYTHCIVEVITDDVLHSSALTCPHCVVVAFISVGADAHGVRYGGKERVERGTHPVPITPSRPGEGAGARPQRGCAHHPRP